MILKKQPINSKNIAQDLAYAVGNIVTSSLTYKQMLSDSMAKFGESGYGIEEYFTGLSEFQESGSISAETFAKKLWVIQRVASLNKGKNLNYWWLIYLFKVFKKI